MASTASCPREDTHMSTPQEIDFLALSTYQRYKLMASLIVPRPIALVTTLDEAGGVNAAPFSMFNMVGEEPPLVMLSVNHRNSQGRLKDTAANILRSGEVVVHERLENESRHVFFGRVQWLRVREGLVDTETWRVRLQDYFPVARFGASFYVRTRDRFAIQGEAPQARRTAIDEI